MVPHACACNLQLMRQTQEDYHKFKANLVYRVRPFLKIKKVMVVGSRGVLLF